MKEEKPILFNTEMVKAVLGGKKSQTRRVIKPKPFEYDGAFEWKDKRYGALPDAPKFESVCPYGSIGQRLWVKETHSVIHNHFGEEECIIYKAEGESKNGCRWKPSIFMRREYSRINLEITKIEVQRVQDITEKDALQEGANGKGLFTSKYYFEQIWDIINEKRGYGWDTNPWVWVIEFEVV